MIQIGITHDPNELRDLERRIERSVRFLGDQRLLKQVTVFLQEENAYHADRGLDRYGKPLRPWKVRHGKSDYHGGRYAQWNNRTVLIPFGSQSRRKDAFLVRADRDRLFGVGVGRVSIFAGFTSRAGRLPSLWRSGGRDVLGLPPRTQRGLSLLLRTHCSNSHGLLKRGRAVLGL